MKNVEISTRFKDKYTGKYHEVKEVLNVSEERYEEIKSFCKVIDNHSEIENNSEGSSKSIKKKN